MFLTVQVYGHAKVLVYDHNHKTDEAGSCPYNRSKTGCFKGYRLVFGTFSELAMT